MENFKIKITALCIAPSEGFNASKACVFKPARRPHRLYFNSSTFLEFEYTKSSEAMTFDEFLYEVGFVSSAIAIIENMEALKSVFECLLKNDVVVAPIREFGDKSNEATLARYVLAVNPRCSKKEFSEIAFDAYLDFGFSKLDVDHAIALYG